MIFDTALTVRLKVYNSSNSKESSNRNDFKLDGKIIFWTMKNIYMIRPKSPMETLKSES